MKSRSIEGEMLLGANPFFIIVDSQYSRLPTIVLLSSLSVDSGFAKEDTEPLAGLVLHCLNFELPALNKYFDIDAQFVSSSFPADAIEASQSSVEDQSDLVLPHHKHITIH